MIKYQFITLILVFSIILSGQNSQEKDVNIQIDFSQFRGDQDRSILEIYYSIPRNAITHYETENGIEGEYNFQCRILYKDEIVSNLSWKGQDAASSLIDIIPTQTIIDYHLLLLKPNEYKIEIDFLSGDMKIINLTSQTIKIENFEDNQLKFNDIQFCSLIERMDTSNRFSKNGYQLTVNPSSIFGTQWSTLYYYSEIYNLNILDEKLDSTYSVITMIKNQDGKVIEELPEKRKVRLGTSLVNVGEIFVGYLKSGAYDLEIKVIDNSNNASNIVVKRFYIYRPADFLASSSNSENENNILTSAFIGFGEEELDREFKFVKYIATSEEKDSYEKLNLEGKRKFMVNFWMDRNQKNRDFDQDFRRVYFDRMDFANRRYSTSGKKGWQTNPGRIILVYGIPDELDKFTSQATMNQYEIWQYYNVQGGVQFVFVDDRGYGDLRLVHSTAVNEIQDYDWQRRYLQQ